MHWTAAAELNSSQRPRARLLSALGCLPVLSIHLVLDPRWVVERSQFSMQAARWSPSAADSAPASGLGWAPPAQPKVACASACDGCTLCEASKRDDVHRRVRPVLCRANAALATGGVFLLRTGSPVFPLHVGPSLYSRAQHGCAVTGLDCVSPQSTFGLGKRLQLARLPRRAALLP